MRTSRSSRAARACALAAVTATGLLSAAGEATATVTCAPLEGLAPGAAIVRGLHDGLPEVTEHLGDDGYRVTRCDADGEPRFTQHNMTMPGPRGEDVVLPMAETRIDADGDARKTSAAFPDFSQAAAAETWERHGAQLRERVLAPTGPRAAAIEVIPALTSPTMAASASDPSCSQYGYYTFARHHDRQNTYYIDLTSFPGRSELVPNANNGGTEAWAAQMAVQGYQAWDNSENPCFRKDKVHMANTFGGYNLFRASYASGDGVSAVDFGSLSGWGNCQGALACAVTRYDIMNGISEADIRFNDGQPFWIGWGNWPAGTYDLRAVATHEAGHAIGMGHVGDVDLTMYGYTGAYPGSGDAHPYAKQRDLGMGDMFGQDHNYNPNF